jgi:beta-glucosidase
MDTLKSLTIAILSLVGTSSFAQTDIFRDPQRSIDVRINDLITKMTLKEKVHQMMHRSPAIERLNIPAYNWWNEGLHGVAVPEWQLCFRKQLP